MNSYFEGVPHFQEDKLINAGAFGRVYKAYKKDTGTVVALKQTLKASLYSQKHHELYNSEVSILKNINCLNVVRYIDSFNTRDSYFLVLEYCNQSDLSKMLSQYQRFPEAVAIEYFKQILNGFRALHKLNVIHRDLKPENILIHDQQLKISDTGFAKQLKEKKSITLTVLGTPSTMAPEVLERKPYGIEVDVYSLGVITYYLIYGEYPYVETKDFETKIERAIKGIKYDIPGIIVSEEMKQLLKRMICYDPKQRITWCEIYNHKLFNSNQTINKSALFPQSMIISNTKLEAIELYKKFKNLCVNDNAPGSSQLLINIQIQNFTQVSDDANSPTMADKSELNKMRIHDQNKVFIAQQIQKYTLMYIQFKSRYTQIYFTIKSILAQPSQYRNKLILFLLAKKMYINTSQMVMSLKHETNYFKIQYYEEFLNTPIYSCLYDELIKDDQYEGLFLSSKMDAKQQLNDNEWANKKQIVQLFKQELQCSELTPDYNQLFKLLLIDSYQNIGQSIQNEELILKSFQSFRMQIDICNEQSSFQDLQYDFELYNSKIHKAPLQSLIVYCKQKILELSNSQNSA